MGALKLELRCPQSVNGIALDPEPDWSFNALLQELNALESKLKSSSSFPISITKVQSRELVSEDTGKKKRSGAFVMYLSDNEEDNYEGDDMENHSRCLVEDSTQCSVIGDRLNFDELYLSDSDDSYLEVDSILMDKMGVVDGALLELGDVHRFGIKEEIRNQISELEMNLAGQYEKSTQTTIQIENYRDARREMEKKLDTQYQRKIAEALDSHLTAVQQDHELRSQIEERKIRSDAAYENAKRKERALKEEKILQEKAIAEAEATRKRLEDQRIAALAAERKAAEEEAAKRAAAGERGAASQMAGTSGNSVAHSKEPGSDNTVKTQSAGNIIKAAESALKSEQGRLQKFKELQENNNALRLNSNQSYIAYERQIARWTKLITGTKDSVRKNANELVNILNDPRCPQTISIAVFAEKVVSQCERPNNSAFACGHAISIVTSRVPHAIDIILAEFHKVCIYTVPKHIAYSKSTFKSREDYFKAIGYREVDGKLETQDAFLKRLEAYMELYAALVQAQDDGVHNIHGLGEGWAWLARFLNSLPANTYTSVALAAFLKMAGFALFRKYRGQFMKMLDFIAQTFLNELQSKKDDPAVNKASVEIKSYIEDKRFLREPEGWRLQDSALLSSIMVPGREPDRSYNSSNKYYY